MRQWIAGAIGASFFLSVLMFWSTPIFWWVMLLFVLVAIVAVNDARQTRHSIRRNFPVVGHFRYLFESIRPEINQYFIESNNDGVPFNRETRSVVYQRAKNQRDTLPFGTRHDVYAPGYECVQHSLNPVHAAAARQTVVIGGDACAQPYTSSVFIVSAMSFGALSSRAIEALNEGAKTGGFAHNTGEGGVSSYHLKHGGDLIWQIGTGYFGCRDAHGNFDDQQFASTAQLPAVKMIEVKLSQGAKPSLGGLLPAAKVTIEIARARGVIPGVSVVSPARHAAFGDFDDLCGFIARLRRLSGGKPVGIKLCLGIEAEFDAMCAAFVHAQVAPDFVTVDGSEGGTGAAPLEFSNHVGTPLFEALTIVHRVLLKYGLRPNVKVIASGKITGSFDMVRAAALGADVGASARGMMLALGCIQALRCDSNKCPAGIATQDVGLTAGLVVKDKAERIASYHQKTVGATCELLGAMGLTSLAQVTPDHVMRRGADGVLRTFTEIYGLKNAFLPSGTCHTPTQQRA